MKLEVGKSYVNRCGETRTIIEETDNIPRPFWDGERFYDKSGRWLCEGADDENDLVEEARESSSRTDFDIWWSDKGKTHFRSDPMAASGPLGSRLYELALRGLAMEAYLAGLKQGEEIALRAIDKLQEELRK